MRVIAGLAKGRKLMTREGQDTRPTTDRSREALFAMLQFEVPGTRFLDLFAGSGGVGIEALSRGAQEAVFVELSRDAAHCVRSNIKTTGFEACSRLLIKDVYQAIRQLGQEGQRFDIIFMDPPYDHDLEMPCVQAILKAGILEEEGLIVVESSSKTDIIPPDDRLSLEKVRDYKVTRFTFLRSTAVPSAVESRME